MTRAEFLTRYYHQQRAADEKDYPLRRAGKPAAVLVPIVAHNDTLTLLLTERAHHLRQHPGQISFPGGKIEQDETAQEAAAREANEEIGLLPENIEWIGNLPKYRTISKYEIIPLLAFIQPQIEYSMNANEVASVFEVPLAYMCNPVNHLSYPVSRNGQQWDVHFIPYKEHMIWGATAAIIRNLSRHIY